MVQDIKQAPHGRADELGGPKAGLDEKARLVARVFDGVADRYDLMNDLMSGGLHRVWKASLIDSLRPRPGLHLLDVAGGTGDIAFRYLDRLDRSYAGADATVTVIDVNPTMLARGRDRAVDRGFLGRVQWLLGDAEALPVETGSVDLCTIAFGIRNVTHIDKALSEAARVLRRGGRFFALEFSHLAIPGLDRLYDAYSFDVIPRLGGLVANNRDAYQYLVESIRRFPDQERFADMIRRAEMSRVTWRNLAGGVVALQSAWKL